MLGLRKIPGMSVLTSPLKHTCTHLKPRHCRHSTFISYWFSFPPTPYVNVKWHYRLRLIYFSRDKCEHFSSVPHYDWLLSVTLCLGQKKRSERVRTGHMGVKLLGQDKCIANHFLNSLLLLGRDKDTHAWTHTVTHLIVFTCSWLLWRVKCMNNNLKLRPMQSDIWVEDPYMSSSEALNVL